MAYCTIADVSVHGLPGTKPYSTTTIPSSMQVTNSLIPYIARYMDVKLKAVGIAVPVVQATSPLAYALLADINSVGAAAKSLRIAYARPESNRSDWIDKLQSEFEKRLDEICKNTAMLQDAAPASNNVGISGVNDLWDTDTPGNVTAHRFYRGHKW